MLTNLWSNVYKAVNGPSNVFSMNNPEDCAEVLNWLWRYFWKKAEIREQPTKGRGLFKSIQEMKRAKQDGRIIIYGNCIEIYICVAILQEENFPYSILTIVKSTEKAQPLGFHTQDIEDAVDRMLNTAEFETYKGTLEYEFESGEIPFVNITTEKKTFRLDCSALLLFDKKSINYRIFKALHHSNLPFSLPLNEGRGYPYLLTNSMFQTHSGNIFAAGNITQMRLNEWAKCSLRGLLLQFKRSGCPHW
ncbi:cilia-and flagella-associated protein 61 [Caerostris extrusa]|uniref:Cilia-and flagella-associated protein 61 n=1 Tax=Caerostris extrusa TaxID=172846 RepID=A0AAV4TZF7_CAEEX|nr:cilia-and flagella-associated protein 61 [Caerostris extrusa]